MKRRHALLGGVALLLVGCGLRPAYGPTGPAGILRDALAVEAPATIPGFRLRERLLRRFGRSDAPRYVLAIALETDRTPVAISGGQETTRYNILGVATWTLRAVGSDAVLAQGTADAFTGYQATGSTVATLAAEEDARARLSVILADQIATRLIAATATLQE